MGVFHQLDKVEWIDGWELKQEVSQTEITFADESLNTHIFFNTA